MVTARMHRLSIVFLVSISVFAMTWHYLGGADRQLVITPEIAEYKAIDDKSQGGASVTDITISPDQTILTCQIVNQAKWPFCEIAIDLESKNEGVDLSRFHSIGIDVDYLTPVKNERLRVYLRNYDPSYSSPDDPVSHKFNAIEFTPTVERDLQVIPLRSFQVLSWWIADYSVPIEKSGPQFNHVTSIEIATGSYVQEGKYTIQLNKLVFYGKWISESSLVKLLLLLWLVFAIVYLVSEQLQLRSVLSEIRKKSLRLRKANRHLFKKAQAVEALAYTDALTGAKNRNVIEGYLSELVDHAKVNIQPFSVIYVDIDHFKSINDNFGHETGDEVLRCFVALINQRIRKSDVFVRWGGEEFILFCPATTLEGAVGLAELLRSIVETYHWPSTMSVTASFGVAQLENENIDEVIKRADKVLYLAKQNGRNCVMSKAVE
ncbi:GGDEF domain-containing protein [Photobacterium sanguinicancri]|uniref:GGDEF domain-containing protein n=1 Tax=Photobacterium sanguinicancri TaxID=875932 RepID=UPI003D102347